MRVPWTVTGTSAGWAEWQSTESGSRQEGALSSYSGLKCVLSFKIH